jgi:hypothetical protein
MVVIWESSTVSVEQFAGNTSLTDCVTVDKQFDRCHECYYSYKIKLRNHIMGILISFQGITGFQP